MPVDLPFDLSTAIIALAKLVVLSLILERSLATLLDYKWYKRKLGKAGLKLPITFVVSWLICNQFNFDTVRQILEYDQPNALGILVTAAAAAGGSSFTTQLFEKALGIDDSKKILKLEAEISQTKSLKRQAEVKKVKEEARKKRVASDTELAIAKAKRNKQKALKRLQKALDNNPTQEAES